MEFIFEETEVINGNEKQADADTSTKGHIQIDRIPDWKLHGNLECRVTLEGMPNFSSEILPSMESHVRRSTFSGPQMNNGQDKTNPRREHVEEFIRDPVWSLTQSVDDEIDTKYEENGIVNNLTSNAEGDRDSDPSPDSILSNMNPKSGSHCPVISEHIELSDFYLRLIQCQHDCDTCQKYIWKLSEHIRATHSEGQLTRDPLHIDLLDMDQSSAIQVKCEGFGDTDTEIMQCSEESDSNSESEVESKSNSDPDYNATPDSNTESDPKSEADGGSDPDSDYNTPRDLYRKSKSGRQKLGKDDKVKLDKSYRKNVMAASRINYEECGKSFVTSSKLGRHKKAHRFKCEECDKSFRSNVKLTVHMRIHTGGRPFKCAECAKSYTTNGTLTIHTRVHTGERPYKCTECPKSFTAKGDLNVHMRIHTGERPYKCEECGQGFTKSSKLGRHRKTHKKKT